MRTAKGVEHIAQVTVGRTDLSRSINEKVDSKKMLELTKKVIDISRSKKIETSVGGNVTPENAASIAEYAKPDKINTREIGFSLNKCRDIYKTVAEMLKFESALLQHKIELFNYQIETLAERRAKIDKRVGNE